MITNVAFPRLPLAASILVMLAGCASSPARPPLSRDLPAGVVGAPVAVPAIRDGDDARVIAARLAAALSTANHRLRDSARRYDQLRNHMRGR